VPGQFEILFVLLGVLSGYARRILTKQTTNQHERHETMQMQVGDNSH